MTKAELEREIRVEELLQKVLIGMDALFSLIILGTALLIPLVYAGSFWIICVEGMEVPYTFWAGDDQGDLPRWILVLGCMALLLLRCYGALQAGSRILVTWNLAFLVGFFVCRVMLRLE